MKTSKRAFDIAVSAIAIPVLALPVLGTAFAMAVATRSNPFFVQERVGYKGKLFQMIKIKTMRDEFTAAGQPLPDAQRTPRIGIWVRKTHLDELPQFLHVLKGEMSIVGPRPITPDFSIAHDPMRQEMVPGITGLAQINGSAWMSKTQMLMFDLAYGKKITLLEDLKILAASPWSVIRHRNKPHYSKTANEEDQITTPNRS